MTVMKFMFLMVD